MTIMWLAIYCAVLVAVALLRTVPIPSTLVQRLRALFPSWRFFDDIGHVPILLVRVTDGGQAQLEQQPWQACLTTPRRRPWALLWNAEANLRLACDSLLMQLLDELEAQAEQTTVAASELVAYQLTEQLVACTVRARSATQRITHYQFKVITHDVAAPSVAPDDVVISKVYAR